ncbi:MAG: PQQ-like beta-propeller repeat protein [Gemmataceae bacterium]|nr:PQQ-like beta-propeller repeat protein [Gemmataceae bacterium]
MRFSTLRRIAACLLCALGAFVVISPAAGWTTYRGNAQRTGADDKAGPEKPKVLWVWVPEVEDAMKKKAKIVEHFVGSPVPAGGKLFLGGVGAFNASTVYCLEQEPKGDKQQVWSRAAPWVKLPVVSSPAVADGKLIFGDGMHQTDGAFLNVWPTDGEPPLWAYPLPGKLVHLEGSPTVVGKQAYFGAGSAGVVCVDLDKATLDGKEIKIADIPKELEARWQAMLKQYDIDYKKDPDFTVKPTKDKLPRPSPVKVWQQGEEKWHVDAPVNVVGDKLLVASAFLDKEKVGDRALHCLEAKTGKPIWRAPLLINPWGGASVEGNIVVVSGSSVAYDPKELKGAKGELAAFELATGKEMWRKELKGGVLSCAALSGGKAICTATDGKVRAYDLEKGLLSWTYDAKSPMFAPPAVVNGVAYIGDLGGVVHAIDISNGAGKWTLNLGTDPAVKMPGMIYAGIVAQGGRLFVATCNLEGANQNKQTAVVCIGQ